LYLIALQQCISIQTTQVVGGPINATKDVHPLTRLHVQALPPACCRLLGMCCCCCCRTPLPVQQQALGTLLQRLPCVVPASSAAVAAGPSGHTRTAALRRSSCGRQV
jgi:hypothetical protein